MSVIKVKILAFDGCEDIELFAFVDIIKRLGGECEIISPFNNEFITTKSGIEINYESYVKSGYLGLENGEADVFYIPGGQIDNALAKFTSDYKDYFIEQISDLLKNGKLMSANCIAPALLAEIGAFDSVSDYKITAYPRTEVGRIPAANYIGEGVDVYQHGTPSESNCIITGNGHPASTINLACKVAQAAGINPKIIAETLKAMGYAN